MCLFHSLTRSSNEQDIKQTNLGCQRQTTGKFLLCVSNDEHDTPSLINCWYTEFNKFGVPTPGTHFYDVHMVGRGRAQGNEKF